jgi:ABC-type polysaccharide/polyol phosphate export permease
MSAMPSYDSDARRSPMLRELLDLVRYRDVVRLFIANLNKTRYKRSVLGIGWTLLNPLLNMAVLTVAFSRVFRFSVEHYPVYVLCGLICWNLFSQTTVHAMNSLVWGGSILRRVYLPRSIFAVSAVGNGLVNLGLALIPLVIIMAVLGHPFHATWWFLPIATLLLAMFSLGMALLVSTVAIFFVDVAEMYGIVIQAWFFLTPIVYPKEILGPRLAWCMNLNPMYNLLELFRTPIVTGAIPGVHTILAGVTSAVVPLLLGWWVFARKADEFAYRI